MKKRENIQITTILDGETTDVSFEDLIVKEVGGKKYADIDSCIVPGEPEENDEPNWREVIDGGVTIEAKTIKGVMSGEEFLSQLFGMMK
jgi:hypothetical protein